MALVSGVSDAEMAVLMARARLEAARLRLLRLERQLREADELGDGERKRERESEPRAP
jgi:hypothetical protein